jgi:hypothetical protein
MPKVWPCSLPFASSSRSSSVSPPGMAQSHDWAIPRSVRRGHPDRSLKSVRSKVLSCSSTLCLWRTSEDAARSSVVLFGWYSITNEATFVVRHAASKGTQVYDTVIPLFDSRDDVAHLRTSLSIRFSSLRPSFTMWFLI